MRRAFSTREKVMLVVLALLIIIVGYVKLVYEPIRRQIDQYREDTAQEQTTTAANTAIVQQIKNMREEVEAQKASGEARAIAAYDNSGALMLELHAVLDKALDYSLSFEALEHLDYIVLRPVFLRFETENYTQARGIIDALHDSKNINQISDLSIQIGQGEQGQGDGTVQVALRVTYFEIMS